MTLSALILIPFFGGLLCWLSERLGAGVPRWIALITMSLVLAIGVNLWFTGDYSSVAGTGGLNWQVEEQYSWIPLLGVSIHFGIDGLSLVMVLLTGLLGVVAVGCSWKEINKNVGAFHMNLLWSLAGVLGVFLALDMMLFFFFWEMMLIPVYFLIALWGSSAHNGAVRVKAATKFFIYTQVGGLVMLVGILALVVVNYKATGQITFAYETLLNTHKLMSQELQFILMLCFFIGFAVKLPIVPVHAWLPDAHAEAPTAGSVDLAGILLKTAGYGMLRFTLPFFPDASQEFANTAMLLGVFGIFYGAFLAFVQTDIKRLIAYTSISHMGFVLIGIYSGNLLTLQGLAIQMLAHGLCAGGLFILAGQLYERLGTRDMREMGGLWARFTYLPPLLMFFAAALLGIPGTANFIGEFLILLGAFKVVPVLTIIATASLVLAGVYSLILIHRTLFGQPTSEQKLAELSAREISLVVSLAVILLVIGFYPQPLLNVSVDAMTFIQQTYAPADVSVPLPIGGTASPVAP
ncbi:MAG TPA: NADH-quinone oxidoreductase subunit M [Cellvibrio sp.]